MSVDIDIYAFFSQFTEPSQQPISSRSVDGKPLSCVYEVQFPGCGYICVAQAVGILGFFRHYERCRMNAEGECPRIPHHSICH